MKVNRIKYGERIDHSAKRLLGKPTNYKQLLEANPDVDPWYPEANKKVIVPDDR